MKVFKFVVLLCLSLPLKGQFAVFDASNFTQIAKQIKEMEKVSHILGVTQEAIKKSHSFLTEVNTAIKGFHHIRRAKILSDEIIKEALYARDLLKGNQTYISLDVIDTFSFRIETILDTLTDTMDLIQGVFKEGILKMNDYQRITLIDKMIEDMEKKKAHLKSTSKRIIGIIAAKKFAWRIEKTLKKKK